MTASEYDGQAVRGISGNGERAKGRFTVTANILHMWWSGNKNYDGGKRYS